MSGSRHPSLRTPPINEVVCGFIYEPAMALTPTQHGAYWVSRREMFPKHEVQPPLQDLPSEGLELSIAFGPPVARTWLITEDDTRLVQIQFDRFFANWRRRRPSDAYPRFRAHDNTAGLLSFALDEFARFSQFAKSLGTVLSVTHLELTKIDVLVRGKHWTDLADLRKLIPWSRDSLDLSTTDKPNLMLKFEEVVEPETRVKVSLANGIDRESGTAVMRLATTIRERHDVSADFAKAFDSLNDRANDMFFKLIPPDVLDRFAGRGKP